MADGNDFFNSLVWPSVEKLLRPQPREVLPDVACGNCVTSRRFAQAGASVLAFDFYEEMIRLAMDRSSGDLVDYRVVDATDATPRNNPLEVSPRAPRGLSHEYFVVNGRSGQLSS